MGKLDLHIWDVNSRNDSIIAWPVTDLTDWIKSSVSSLADTFAPSLKVMSENTAHAWANLWNISNISNWWKLARTIPVVWSDIIMKAKSLPFRTLDLWIQYIVNNNLERIVWATKSVTTDALGNWFTSNWESKVKWMNIIWDTIKWIWDLVGSLIKAPTWLIGLWANKLNKYVWNIWIETTDKWINNLRISDQDYFTTPIFANTWDTLPWVRKVDFGRSDTASNDSEYRTAA